MIADLLVYELGDVILLTMSGEVTATVLGKLDQFIFSEDVKLGDVTGTFAQWAVIGPGAAKAVAAMVTGVPADVLAALEEHGNVRALFDGRPAIVARVTDTGEPGFDVFVERAQADALEAAIAEWRRGCDRCGHGRHRPDRIGGPDVSSRYGRGNDPARSGDRRARDQPDEGMLRRSGGHHPRVASRARPRRAKARRSCCSRAVRRRPPARPYGPATARSGT